jgi:sigma-B regulation protein RsbU (phosphoserine phosphatase)
MWYGVYNQSIRELRYACAGHHPAFLISPGADPSPLRTRGGVVGADPGTVYRTATAQVPPQASFYLFSDGVFEIVTKDGLEWGLNDFLRLLPGEKAQGQSESMALFGQVRGLVNELDDDFSLLILRLD